jgi:RNA polymerase sigma-70 factor (ECF subfamily)
VDGATVVVVDPDSFSEALVRQVPGLLRYAHAITRDPQAAEDLVSATVVRALERQASFLGDSSLPTWLHRILHNLAVDRFRRTREVPAEDAAERVERDWRDDTYTVDAATVVARAETRSELRDALIRLPFIYRSAVLLHDGHGLTGREIAEIQHVSLPAVKQRLRRGRMMLVTALARGQERRAALKGVPMRCWEARSRVSDYLDAELPPEQRLLVEKHLQTCPTCPPLYASLVGARSALADLDQDPDSVIPPDIVARLRG